MQQYQHAWEAAQTQLNQLYFTQISADKMERSRYSNGSRYDLFTKMTFKLNHIFMKNEWKYSSLLYFLMSFKETNLKTQVENEQIHQEQYMP